MPTIELPRLPFPIPDITHVAPAYRELQAEGPVCQVRTATGDTAWLVTRYEEVRALFGDDRLGRTHPDPERAARVSDSVLGAPLGNHETEQEDHARLRTLLTPAFSARRMQLMRPRIERFTAQLLDRLATLDRPADLHRELAYPLPVQVICELLGIPREDHDKVQQWSEALNQSHDRERSANALGDLMEYTFELIQRKQAEPADDVLSEMVASAAQWGQIGRASCRERV